MHTSAYHISHICDMEASCPGCASHKSPSNARCYQYGPTFLKNAFSILLNQCHIELRQFWRRKEVKHSISMVFL